MARQSWTAPLGRVVLVALLLAPASRARAEIEGPCAAAISAAETRARIPVGLLTAMGIVESGRASASGALQPWPWAVNNADTGRLYDTAEEAIAATARLRLSGQRSIDVGCLQVNLMHHPAAFISLRDAFDPVLNADYAAHFLVSLRSRSLSQDWMEAVGHYHSFRADLAEAYRARVRAVLEAMPGGRASQAAGSSMPIAFRQAARGPAVSPQPPPARQTGALAGDWLHLLVLHPRLGWRAPDPGGVLSPDRSMVLAGALEKLAAPRTPSRLGSVR